MIRIFRHYVPKSLLILGTSEAAILYGSIYLAVAVSFVDFNPTQKLLVGSVWTKALWYTVVMMLVMATMGLYERGLRDQLRGILFRVGAAFFLALLLMLGLGHIFPSVSIGSDAFMVGFAGSVAGIVLFRTLIFHFLENDWFKRRVLILGAGPMASQVEQLRRKVDRRGMNLVGYVHLGDERDEVDKSKILRIKSSLLDLAVAHRVDEIVVAVDDRRTNFPTGEILDCKVQGVRIIDLAQFFEQQTGKIKLDALSPSSMIFADGFRQAVIKGYIHRLLDVVLSLAMLAVVWPVMLVTVVAIFVESRGRGSVLYRQTRVGRNGRSFRILKFRSMCIDAEKDGELLWATKNDSRITRVGAVIRMTRIDELPQLLNVLKGEMSFVGPRPERPEFVEELAGKIPFYDLRHCVNPGITGWAQICYPYGASEKDAKEKLQYDLYYIKNYSLFLDLMILLHTAQVILWGKGAR